MAMQTPNGQSMADINITPLVDVMLVLLIIFMVAAPVMERQRSKKEIEANRDQQQRLIAMNLPSLDRSSLPSSENKTLVLKIQADYSILLDNKVIAQCQKPSTNKSSEKEWETCLDNVEKAFRLNNNAKEYGISVDAAVRVPFGLVTGILHRAYRADLERVSLFPKVL